MSNRLSQLRQSLADVGVDGFLIASPSNRRYLSGFTGSAGSLVITENRAKLVTDFRYVDQAKAQAPQFDIVNNDRSMVKALAQEIKQLGIKRLAFEKQQVSFASYEEWKHAFEGVELVPVSGIVEQLRMIKDERELEVVRTAVRIADDAFTHILPFIKPGVREIDIAIELEFFMRKQGAQGSAFEIIVASGERGALPHGAASMKTIEPGDMVTMDYGALYEGYCSDITRTVSVGEPNPKMKEIYDVVLSAQVNAVSQLRPGMTGREGDALARDVIAAAGYGAAFGHSTGHSFGLDVHELPSLAMSSDQILKPGMLMTVEPGIYVSGLGGVRIEDDVLITEDGCVILTQSTKELLILNT